MIDISNIFIPNNYVLVLPDPKSVTLQKFRKETSIIASDYIYDNKTLTSVQERNLSVYGTVFAVPNKIGFHRERIAYLMDNYTVAAMSPAGTLIANRGVFNEIGELTRQSCLFETENELEVGDRINFSYQSHKFAIEAGAMINTIHGIMYFIKYDLIYMSVNEDLSPKKMINGYILIEPEAEESQEKDGIQFKTTESGFMLPQSKEKFKRNRKLGFATVLASGNKNGGYLQREGLSDPDIEVPVGSRILYDPRGAQRLENNQHQRYSDKMLQLIQRRDIWHDPSVEFDLDTVSLKHRTS